MSIKSWPFLYKMSSTGKEQQWGIKVFPSPKRNDLDQPEAEILVEHGRVGGKLQLSVVRVAEGKNLGRANETSPWDQAVSEAEAKWKKQLDKGYATSHGGAEMDLKPMLAHDYQKHKEKVDYYEAFVQPKLDGVRCLAYRESATNVRLISRQGKDFTGLNHLREDLKGVLEIGQVFDGELYVHGRPFQEIISLVKKAQEGSKELQYHVYDLVSPEPFPQRTRSLYQAIGQFNVGRIRYVTTSRCMSPQELEDWHRDYVQLGYEGVMLRWGNEPYKSGYRSGHLLKVKAFLEEEFDIVKVVDGKGKFEGRAIFQCRTEAGAQFEAVPRGSDGLRREYYERREELRGKRLTVRFFEWTTSSPPVPRFPVAIGVRDYE